MNDTAVIYPENVEMIARVEWKPAVSYQIGPVEKDHKRRMKVVFISGPYRSSTEWGVKKNIYAAELAAMHVWQIGGVAVCPHANTAFFGGACPDETWLNGDLEILRRCDGVYALVNWRLSKGAKAEVALARELGLPVWEVGNVTDERNLEAFIRGEL